nr:glycosyltransferase [uncultured Oscillibacter sp.]
MEKRPLLSIGIIFKNEIRCLERCLKSLQPLREAIPCQVVMADTGSTDGSRAVAERYADIVFDFPWIDDFAAARNAVLDRSSGKWFLTIDSDEWMDGDVSELTDFLQSRSGEKNFAGAVVVRNYTTYDFNGPYMDFFAGRLVSMEVHPRYVGAVHERWNWPGCSGRHIILRRTVLHHDGYVEFNRDGAAGREKERRNMALLREKAKREPENLAIFLQMVESGKHEPDFLEILRQAVELVEKRKPLWQVMGPPILRYAVAIGRIEKLPEVGEWIQKAEEWFPDSAFTRIDVAFVAFAYFLEQDEFEEAARRGEIYLKSLAEDRAGTLDPQARLRSVLQMDSALQEQALKISLADVYRNLERLEEARGLLAGLDFSVLDPATTEKLAQALMNLRMLTNADTEDLVTAAWEGISAPAPDEETARQRRKHFCEFVLPAFHAATRETEEERPDALRHTYTLLLPLRGKCEPGTAAAMLETEDAARLESLLTTVEDWTALPPEALDHALRRSVRFPLPEKPLNVETMDLLAARLAGEPEALFRLARTVEWDVPQMLCWARALLLAAVRAFDWKEDTFDKEGGLALARRFAAVEKAFLSLCYTSEALTEEGLFLLPLLHRFGWYCAQAFDALEAGDAAMYARYLREGLASCPEMKPMAEFLAKHTPELQPPPPSPELLALAEQVRTMLAAYDPNDPAVAAIKASPVYRRVAYLIEGGGV